MIGLARGDELGFQVAKCDKMSRDLAIFWIL